MWGFFNGIIKALANCITAVSSILPPSPFTVATSWMSPITAQILKGINWIVPVQAMLDTLAAWVLCIAAYYITRILLKWAKAASN